VPLALDPTVSGTAHSLNDGTLSLAAPAARTAQSYPAVPSDTFQTDPPNTAIVGNDGPNQMASFFPPFTETALSEPLGLSFTTAPLRAPVDAAGPLDLDLRLSTTVPGTAIWAVVSDVWPDGSSHPLTVGRLSTDYPLILRRRSLRDPLTRAVVQPYGDYTHPSPAQVGTPRLYHVELWPIGNRFEAGHRIRLDVLGASAASRQGAPALDTVVLGGRHPSRLMFPVLPGSDLPAALG
jgi:predicted acyl esterase